MSWFGLEARGALLALSSTSRVLAKLTALSLTIHQAPDIISLSYNYGIIGIKAVEEYEN
jgi:hypothetical protein